MKDLQKVENPNKTFLPASSHMYMTVCRKRKSKRYFRRCLNDK